MNTLSRLMLLCLLISTLLGTTSALAEDSSPAELPPLTLADVFQLEWASDPQVSPDGKTFLLNPRWKHWSMVRASDFLTLHVDDKDLWLVTEYIKGKAGS